MAVLEISTEWIITAACGAVSSMVGLYTKSLKTEVDSLKEKRIEDLTLNSKEHESLRTELNDQRKTLTENHDAVVRLITVVEQLNQTLVELKLTISDKVSIPQCSLLMKGKQ